MQKSQLEAEIARILNDTNNTRWPLATIDTRIDLAQTDVQAETNAVKTIETLTPTANVETITLSANLLDVLMVTLTDSAGNVYPLTGTYLEQLVIRRPLWKNETAGQPDSYYIDFTNNQIHLIPTPSAQWAIAGAINVTESQIPPAIASAASTVVPFNSNSLMIPYHLAICYWVAGKCLADNADAESLQKSQFYYTGNLEHPGQYEIMLGKIINRFDKPTDERGRILWKPAGGRLGGWPVSKSSPLG